MEGVLTLIGTTWVQDDRGVWRETSRARDILCRIDSVTRSEFFEGGRNGLNPELQFTVFSGDYEGEMVCQYEGKQYGIYRTYRVPGTDYMELYAERKGGTNA